MTRQKSNCCVCLLTLVTLIWSIQPTGAQTKSPVVPENLAPEIVTHQAGVQLTLLAEHPALVTPTGIDIDSDGRIWLIACHTHFPPDAYPGPKYDEVLVFDADGQNRRVFYNKTKATMHIKLGDDGWVYLAQRDRILRVKDTDGDGVGDFEETVAALDTVSDYPHNGLSGMDWHPNGGLVFSLGENFGKDWTLTARDGSQVTGRGEGGVFWAQADGTRLRRIARGFWNPFGLLVRPDGEIFAAENDPGSRPPCRLLQILEGADYGFQWVYGSAPIHPFVAWNGELRGTLGMIHPCCEGPSSIVQLGGGVLIPSWSNHTVEYYPLVRQGAGYTSQRVEVVSGGEYFRPVGMAVADSGDIYVTDWVYSSYELHQRGRLWKLSIDRTAAWVKPEPEPLNAQTQLANGLRDGSVDKPLNELMSLAASPDSYLADAALSALARYSSRWSPDDLIKMSTNERLLALVALRRVDLQEDKWIRALWNDTDPAIRFELLRWIADGVHTSFSAEVEQLLKSSDIDYVLFEAALAAWNTLRGNPGAGVTDPEVLADRLIDPSTPTKIKSYALRLMPPTHKRIDVALLQQLFDLSDRDLQGEVVRSLSGISGQSAWEMLMQVAANTQLDIALRADAIHGLSQSAVGITQAGQVDLLLQLAASSEPTLRTAALRAMRSLPVDEKVTSAVGAIARQYPESAASVAAVLKPAHWKAGRPELADTAAWLKRLDDLPGNADVEAGRRLFHHAQVGQCANCHRHSGRGNVVGPDLSLVALQSDREQLLKSILEPNRDVAPQYFATALQLEDGSIFTGILLRSSNVDVYRDSVGKERVFKKSDVVERKELKTSLMPSGLVDQMTDEELRDLLAFLSAAQL